MNLADLSAVSDEELLSGLESILCDARRLLARLLAYLGEVEARRLHLAAACPSLFEFCLTRLGMSDGEAFRRITAARLARRFPAILEKVARGEIHLTGLVLLRDHLTDSNHEELLREASGKTKRQVQELIVSRSPKPDAPTSIRALPEREASPEQAPLVHTDTPEAPTAAGNSARSATVPLSPSRYKLQLTIDAQLEEKLTRAADLMRHRNPSGDLTVVLDRAVDLLIAELEKERFGKTQRPRRPAEGSMAKRPRAGYVPSAVRREVYDRDGGQCTFVDESGRRCSSRAFLEIDHVHAKALGGAGDGANTRLLCRPHNALLAERLFGREHVEACIDLRQRKRRARSGSMGAATSKTAPAIATTDSRGAGSELVASTRSAIEDGPARAPASDPGGHAVHVAPEVPGARREGQLAGEAAPRECCPDISALLDTAGRALERMGFRHADTRRALSVVQARVGASGPGTPRIEQLVIEALAVLT